MSPKAVDCGSSLLAAPFKGGVHEMNSHVEMQAVMRLCLPALGICMSRWRAEIEQDYLATICS